MSRPAERGTDLIVSVWRGKQEGRFVDFEVPIRENQTVLDVVTYIQRHIDSTLSYRFACRVGMCGSCAMTVNGVPRWTCRTHVSKVARNGRLTVGPLQNLAVIKDLTVDMDPFFYKWQQAHGAYRGDRGRTQGFSNLRPDSSRRQDVDAAIECIGCGICYAACDVVRWNPDYLGPAALNRAWTLVQDERDAQRSERLRVVSGDAGCHACHSHQSCREWCPKHLNPTAAIAGLKRMTLWAALQGNL